MYAVQSITRRAPLEWIVIDRPATLGDAIAFVRRVLTPWPGQVAPDKHNYRIVEHDTAGRIRKVFFANGTEILLTAEHRKQLREQRLPIAA